LIGFVAPLGNVKIGRLALTAVSAVPRDREQGSPWAGMSGAAVFAGPYLIGVVIVDPEQFSEARLVAAATSPLCADARFAELVGASTAALQSVQPRFRLAVTQELSIVLRPPYRPLEAGLTFARSPVRLLLPEYGVVPFLGREQPLAELRDWCRSPDKFAVKVVTGDGGSGKTRLSAELASQLMADGWDAGFSDPEAPGGVTRLEHERSTLLIVDDAESNVSLVSGLVTTLAEQSGGPPFRLILLARHPGAWWQQLNTNTEGLAEDFAGPHLALHAGRLWPDEQRRHFEAAFAAFAAQLERPQSGIPTSLGNGLPWLGEDMASPLVVHMYALLTVLGDTGGAIADASAAKSARERMLRRMLDGERRRWQPLAAEFGDTITMQAVTVVNLLAPSSRLGLLSALETIPSLRKAEALQRERIADRLRDAYPGGAWIGPLRPDLMTEQLLAETPDLPELVLSAADHATSAEQCAHLLSELTRAAPNRTVVRDALAALLGLRLSFLLDVAIDNATTPFGAILELALREVPQQRLQNARILWVDDRPDNNRFERQALEALGIRIELSTSTDDALMMIRDGPYDLIISDMGRPPDERAGYTLLDALRDDGDQTPFVIYAGSRAAKHVQEARQHGAIGSTNLHHELFAIVTKAIITQQHN
jgi:CheY-like chemotaxis protein